MLKSGLRTFAKTLTDGELSENGMELRIAHPRAPHTKPHPDGGHIVLYRYVAERTVVPMHGQGCHGANQHHGQHHVGEGRLEAEVIKYSGYREDNGLVMILEKRGVEGTVPKHWAAGTMVSQNAYGADFALVMKALNGVLDQGCLVAVPRAGKCEVIKAGKWRCIDGCWRKALKDTMVTEGTELPAAGEPATDDWSGCHDVDELLDLIINTLTEADVIKLIKAADTLTGAEIAALIKAAEKVVCVGYGSGPDGGDVITNEKGVAFRINPRVEMSNIEIPNITTEGSDSFTLIETSYQRKFAKSQLVVEITAETDVAVVNKKIGDGVYWSHYVVGKVGEKSFRISNNKYNNAESDAFTTEDKNRTSSSGSRRWVIDAGSGSVGIKVVAAFHDGGPATSTDDIVITEGVTHRSLSDSHITVVEYEVLESTGQVCNPVVVDDSAGSDSDTQFYSVQKDVSTTVPSGEWVTVSAYNVLNKDLGGGTATAMAGTPDLTMMVEGAYNFNAYVRWASGGDDNVGQRLMRFIREYDTTADHFGANGESATVGKDHYNNSYTAWMSKGRRIAVQVWQDSGADLALEFAQFKAIKVAG